MLLLQDQDRVAEAMGYADADALMLQHRRRRARHRVGDRAVLAARRPCSSATVGARAKPSKPERLAPGVRVDRRRGADRAGRRGRRAVVRVPVRVGRGARRPADERARSLRLLASRGTPPGEAWTERTRRAFVSLLGSGEWLVPTVEALERYDLFSRYLPEWRAVRSLPQRNAFHTYTVDHHLLQTIANANEFVRDVAAARPAAGGCAAARPRQGLPGRPHRGRRGAGRHAIGARMGFGEADIAVVADMVRHHLLLPETATRRDLSDPRTASQRGRRRGRR